MATHRRPNVPPEAPAAANDARPPKRANVRPRQVAVGDVRSGSVKRVATAVGEGAAAVQYLHQVLAGV